MSFVNVEQEPISFRSLVECRRQEMEGVLPGMQTRIEYHGQSAVIKSSVRKPYSWLRKER